MILNAVYGYVRLRRPGVYPYWSLFLLSDAILSVWLLYDYVTFLGYPHEAS